MRVEFRNGRAYLLDTPATVSWRPVEFLNLLIGARPEADYVGRLLLPPAEVIAGEWAAGGYQPITREELARRSSADFAAWLGIEEDLTSHFPYTAMDELCELLAPRLAELRDLFQVAVRAAANEGRLHERLAAPFATVTRLDRARLVDAPDAVAFGAWCLNRLLHSARELKLDTCPLCKEPWLRERRDALYCSRPAPGVRTTCRALAAQRAYAEAHSAYSRERRRLAQLARRGRLTADELAGWRAANRPGTHGLDWISYDEWKNATGGGS